MGFYLEHVGYDMYSAQFDEFIQNWKSSNSMEKTRLIEKQIRNAEINMKDRLQVHLINNWSLLSAGMNIQMGNK